MLKDIVWTCHICGERRSDSKISVLTKPIRIGGVKAKENIRYCNDKPECIEGAKDYTHFPRSRKEENS